MLLQYVAVFLCKLLPTVLPSFHTPSNHLGLLDAALLFSEREDTTILRKV